MPSTRRADPDLRLEGQPADVYTPWKDETLSVVSSVDQKAQRRQAVRIVVNLAESTVTRAQLEEELRQDHHPDLKEVITIDRFGYIGHALF